MPVTADRIRKLMDFGLTEYEARVYLALLDLGTATASQIPAGSRVPRTRIYGTMRQLHGKGLVQILPENPLRYKAAPLGAFLRSLVEDYRNRAEHVDANLETVAREFSIAATESAEERGRFEAIYGRRNVRDKLAEMYEGASKTIISVGSTHSPGRILRSFAPHLADRKRAGVQIRLAFHVTPQSAQEVRALGRYGEVRTVDFFLPVCRHGVDGREFLMTHPIPDDGSTSRGEDIAIWTDDPAIAGALAQMAGLLWEMGKPIVVGEGPEPSKAGALTPSGES